MMTNWRPGDKQKAATKDAGRKGRNWQGNHWQGNQTANSFLHSSANDSSAKIFSEMRDSDGLQYRVHYPAARAEQSRGAIQNRKKRLVFAN
jgi:hypothetical protein